MPCDEFILLWDRPDDPDGNIREMSQRYDVSFTEVEDVLNSSAAWDHPLSSESASASGAVRARAGWTSSGRYLLVIYDVEAIQPGLEMIYPLSAYDYAPPPVTSPGSRMEDRP